jgi:hypothetical protein
MRVALGVFKKPIIILEPELAGTSESSLPQGRQRSTSCLVFVTMQTILLPSSLAKVQGADLRYDARVDIPVTVAAGVGWSGSEALKSHLAAQPCRWYDRNADGSDGLNPLDASVRVPFRRSELNSWCHGTIGACSVEQNTTKTENRGPGLGDGNATKSPTGAADSRLLILARLAEQAGAEWIAGEAKSLAERVVEGRFYVACLGQFKRGKSSLLNALLGRIGHVLG